MNVYYNSGDSERYWVTISRPDGRTLQLKPGEEARLDLPADFSDPYLKLKVAAPPTKSTATKAEDTTEV